VQSIAEEALDSVSRHSNILKLFENVNRLLEETRINVHLDLVAGLPGEDFEGFIASLERLLTVRPHHIQVEPLKVLKGAPMMTIAQKEGYVWSQIPPYRIVKTPWLTTEEINGIETIGRLLELIYNSDRFKTTLAVMGNMLPLSKFFVDFAAEWERRGISTLSLEDLFETVWQFFQVYFKKETACTLSDALSFDRCRADYPVQKRLPSYFSCLQDHYEGASRKAVADIRQNLKIDPKIRVRLFRRIFSRDYRIEKKDGPRELLFVYLSKPGGKQEVRIYSKGELG
jgi:anaerobic magnesium-protoporphyrin IX monomethyl ester cyclase